MIAITPIVLSHHLALAFHHFHRGVLACTPLSCWVRSTKRESLREICTFSFGERASWLRGIPFLLLDSDLLLVHIWLNFVEINEVLLVLVVILELYFVWMALRQVIHVRIFLFEVLLLIWPFSWTHHLLLASDWLTLLHWIDKMLSIVTILLWLFVWIPLLLSMLSYSSKHVFLSYELASGLVIHVGGWHWCFWWWECKVWLVSIIALQFASKLLLLFLPMPLILDLGWWSCVRCDWLVGTFDWNQLTLVDNFCELVIGLVHQSVVLVLWSVYLWWRGLYRGLPSLWGVIGGAGLCVRMLIYFRFIASMMLLPPLCILILMRNHVDLEVFVLPVSIVQIRSGALATILVLACWLDRVSLHLVLVDHAMVLHIWVAASRLEYRHATQIACKGRHWDTTGWVIVILKFRHFLLFDVLC